MEENVLKIKCSFCGAMLSVKRQPGIESKFLTCPVCNSKAPFTSYKILGEAGGAGFRSGSRGKYDDDPTQYSGGGRAAGYEDGPTQYGGGSDDTVPEYGSGGQSDGKTQINLGSNWVLGKLTVEETGQSYQLKPGRNVVGRKAQSSSADFQIAATADKRMSREHLVIEVKKVPGKGFVHYVSLFKEQCNPTQVGHETLMYGDCLILNHGDRLRLPGVTVKFEIPDGEGTEM